LKILSTIFSTKQLHLLILCTFQDSANRVFGESGFGKSGLNPLFTERSAGRLAAIVNRKVN